jgi:hypothetical protein
MDKDLLEKFLKLIASENDGDAVMGLRGAQSLFQSSGLTLEDGLRHAASTAGQWKKSASPVIDHQSAAKPAASSAVNISGVPECRVKQAGVLEIVLSGKTEGDIYPLPGEAAKDADAIAAGMKDAVVAAVINKSRFKLKLNDIKNGRGDIVETILQAEYERAGMIPIRIWANNRGEVGALATVLRKAVVTSMPELAAA